MKQLQLFPTLTPSSWVYIGARNGFIKIGVSDNPARRAKQLRMDLLWTQPGTRADERVLHQRFRRSRIDREWFMPNPDVLAFLRSAA